jgi:AraC-like DNA-binding protein
VKVARASHFVSWDGGCLFLTRGGGLAPVHAHYAIQIAFCDVPGIRFRASDRDPWTSYDGVVIASRQPHTMDATGSQLNAVLFVEPETREGRALSERFGHTGIATLPDGALDALRARLFAAWQEEGSASAVVGVAHDIVRLLTGGMESLIVSDERILRATAYIRSHLESPLTLEEVAEVACLSPSRFRHLFVEQTGMALRPYILWRRFLRVWELLAEGISVSAAAHAAGFADAAHLSRTSRRAFGFPPSAMPMAPPLPPERGEGQPLRSRGQPLHSRAGKPAPVT